MTNNAVVCSHAMHFRFIISVMNINTPITRGEENCICNITYSEKDWDLITDDAYVDFANSYVYTITLQTHLYTNLLFNSLFSLIVLFFASSVQISSSSPSLFSLCWFVDAEMKKMYYLDSL